MKYILIIYTVFILFFDLFGGGSQSWNVLYFTMQYLFVASVGLSCLFRCNGSPIPYLLVSAFFLTLAVFEVNMLLLPEDEYFYTITSSEPLTSCSIVFIVITLSLILLRKII